MTKRVNGKNKGSQFERKIANLLSQRFAEYLGIEQGFRRNIDSGSYFGGSNATRTQTHSMDYAVFGDLVCPKNFKFSIECKHYKTPPTFQSIVEQSVKQWDEWLTQAQQDAVNSGKLMALIVKYNNVNELIFSDQIIHGSLTPCLTYKNYHIYKLSDVLGLNDQFFFGIN